MSSWDKQQELFEDRLQLGLQTEAKDRLSLADEQ